MKEFIEAVKDVVFVLSVAMTGVFIFAMVVTAPVWLVAKIFGADWP